MERAKEESLAGLVVHGASLYGLLDIGDRAQRPTFLRDPVSTRNGGACENTSVASANTKIDSLTGYRTTIRVDNLDD